MSYWALSNLKDGERPGYREATSASDVLTGEVLVQLGTAPSEMVWDAATLRLRPATSADNLVVSKREKRKELLLVFKAEYALIWIIDGIEVEEQKDSILAKTAANRTASETNLVNQAGTLITKIKSKFTDVNNATTAAQVAAITWT